MDGIDDYPEREIEWAVDAVFENAREVGLLTANVTVEELLAPAWDFVVQVFEEAGLTRPDRAHLEALVAERLPEIAHDLE
jgi:adenosylcobinamide amidohydrolase